MPLPPCEVKKIATNSDLHVLSDSDLSVRLHAIQQEVDRRARALADCDFSIIKGHEAVKRAVLVSVVGNHSLCLIGSPNSGKTMLRAAAFKLGNSKTFEVRPCRCGWLNNPHHPCSCDVTQVLQHVLAKQVIADMWIEVCQVPQQEMDCKRTTPMKHYTEQIELARKQPLPEKMLDKESKNLLDVAQREIGFDHGVRQRYEAVSGTIARMDCSRIIRCQHVCEAVCYRAPKGWF